MVMQTFQDSFNDFMGRGIQMLVHIQVSIGHLEPYPHLQSLSNAGLALRAAS